MTRPEIGLVYPAMRKAAAAYVDAVDQLARDALARHRGPGYGLRLHHDGEVSGAHHTHHPGALRHIPACPACDPTGYQPRHRRDA